MADPNIRRPFMTARWTQLLVASFAASEEVLLPYVPPGTELDRFNGSPIMSIVSFRFCRMRVLMLRFPSCEDFIQVNMRFYVRRRIGGEFRRGVVFIKEICPSPIACIGARALFRENYFCERTSAALSADSCESTWRYRGEKNSVSISGLGDLHAPAPGSIEEFAVARDFGYVKFDSRTAAEFQVDRVPWKMRSGDIERWKCTFAPAYAGEFRSTLSERPLSVSLVDGSDVRVSWRRVSRHHP